jgi:hypothetical protein
MYPFKKNTGEEDIVRKHKCDLDMIVNNNPSIVIAIMCDPFLVYIRRVPDSAYTPVNEYQQAPSHPLYNAWDCCIG